MPMTIAESNAWIERFRITDNRGTYRTRDEVVESVANELRRRRVANPTAVARAWINNEAWLSFRAGETAGSIARGVADEVIVQWGSVQ